MKYSSTVILILLLNFGCTVHKIQNTEPNTYVCEFEIYGISSLTYNNDLLPRLNRALKKNNLISANDSNTHQKNIDTFKFKILLETGKIVNISVFVGYFKIFAYEVFKTGGNFNLNIYNARDKNKILIYQYSKKSRANLFSTKANYIFLKKYFYKINSFK